jgi:hypothetical protein
MHQFIIVLVILFAGIASAQTSERITFTDSSFSYEITVHSVAPAGILFAYLATDTATLLLRGSASSIVVDSIDTFIRKVTTVFKAFGYQATTLARKTVIPEQMIITMNVDSFVHNWMLLPMVRNGLGLYQVFPKDTGGSFLRYQQNATLDRKIKPITRLLIRWQLGPLGRDIKKTIGAYTTGQIRQNIPE